jgi:DNA (cytosine-5)-methyltransferase 1
MSDLKFADLFSGIGGFRIAFEEAGAECVFSCEIDKFARHTYSTNFFEEEIHWRDAEKVEDHPEIFGDIREITQDDDTIEKTVPDFDILAAGFPCPTFSLAGISKRNALDWESGLDDEEKGQLFFEIAKVLDVKKPDAFLLENVKNLLNHDSGETYQVIKNTLCELGYDPVTEKVFDAASLVPQHRERVFIAGFRKELGVDFDISNIEIEDQNPQLKEILIDHEEVSEEYTLTDHLWEYLQDYKEKHRAAGNGFGFSIADPEGVTRTMSARYHKDGSEILIDQGEDKNPRMLTEREAARLFGYPENFEIPVSRTQAYQQFGNSVCVPLVKILAETVIQALEGESPAPSEQTKLFVGAKAITPA